MKEPLEDFDYTNEPSYIGISAATALDLSQRYQQECQRALSGTADKNKPALDARSVLISIETLKKYIWEIEQHVRETGSVQELGIRIYFGKYPDIPSIKKNAAHPLFNDLHTLPDAYSHLHTLFMVPAYKGDDDVFKDFDPFQAQDIRLQQIDMQAGVALTQEGSMTAVLNHGNLTPPPFVSTTDTDYALGMSF